MTLTVDDLRHADTGGVAAAAGLLAGVTNRLQGHGTTFVDKVLTPVRAGEEWTGAGQPEALEVVSADAIAVATAASRLQLAVNTLYLFSQIIGASARTVGSIAGQAEAAKMHVALDGTVDPGDDTSGDREERAEGWTKALQGELRRAERIDQISADTMRRLAGHDTRNGKGYTLPVFSEYAGNNLLQRSTAAWKLPYRPEWKPYSNTFNAHGGYLLGPDNRLYPIVVVTDTRQTEDPRWHTIGTRKGYDDFAPDPTGDVANGIAIFLGKLAGLGAKGYPVDGERTKTLRFGGPTAPTVGDTGVPYPKRPGTEGYKPGEHPGQPDLGRTPGARPANPVPNSLGGLQLIGAAGEGAVLASRVDDGHQYAYETVYQQDDKGHLRAVVKTYQVQADDQGVPKVYSTSAHVGEDGTYEHHPLDTPAPG